MARACARCWLSVVIAACGGGSGASRPSAPAAPVADAPPPPADDEGDALTPDRHRAACAFRALSPGDAAGAFDGVDPWRGLADPTEARCCQLPSEAVLCLVGEQVWAHAPSADGVLAFAYLVERARLFDRGARTPWRDVILEVRLAGPMAPPRGGAAPPPPPVVSARLEVDATALHVIPTEQRVCAPGVEVACDAEEPAAACAALRRQLAPAVRAFCQGLGVATWRGARLTRPAR